MRTRVVKSIEYCKYEFRSVKISEYCAYVGGSYFKPPWGIEMGKNSRLLYI